ncbi:MAG: hypothetical protein JWQ69_5904, partial [Pseudomonas sp.]|nr:hypothetical protein [Pseudomonas sp.]
TSLVAVTPQIAGKRAPTLDFLRELDIHVQKTCKKFPKIIGFPQTIA